jgi:hypothetical protein
VIRRTGNPQDLTISPSPPATLLIAITLVVSVALFYLAVLTIIQISIACRRIGKFLYKCKVNVQPLHPDRCGGLRPVGHMLDLVLTAAAILGDAGLCIFLAVQDTPSGPTRRPESYVLAIFLLLSAPQGLLQPAVGATSAHEGTSKRGSHTGHSGIPPCG